jgi:hypothetical protein
VPESDGTRAYIPPENPAKKCGTRRKLRDPADFCRFLSGKNCGTNSADEIRLCSDSNKALKMYERHATYSCIIKKKLQTTDMFMI